MMTDKVSIVVFTDNTTKTFKSPQDADDWVYGDESDSFKIKNIMYDEVLDE